MNLTPRFVSSQSIRARGAADPPQSTVLRLDRSYSPGLAFNSFMTPSQIVGTPAENVARSFSIRLQIDAPSIVEPAKTCLAPIIVQTNGRPQAFAWNIGTAAIMVSCRLTPIVSGSAAATVCR